MPELKWEGYGVGLDGAPWGAVEVYEPAPRANPSYGIKSIVRGGMLKNVKTF